MGQPLTLYRVALREKCAEVLRAAGTMAGQNVFTARSWPATTDILPAIWITAPRDEGESVGRGGTDFIRTASIGIRGIVTADTPDGAMRLVDDMGAAIENALMTSIELMAMIQQVSFIRSESEVTSEQGPHFGEIRIHLGLEYAETWKLSGEALTAIKGEMTKGKGPPYPPPV